MSYSQQNVKCNKHPKTNAGYSFNIDGNDGYELIELLNEKTMINTAGLMRYWPCSCAGNHMDVSKSKPVRLCHQHVNHC